MISQIGKSLLINYTALKCFSLDDQKVLQEARHLISVGNLDAAKIRLEAHSFSSSLTTEAKALMESIAFQSKPLNVVLKDGMSQFGTVGFREYLGRLLASIKNGSVLFKEEETKSLLDLLLHSSDSLPLSSVAIESREIVKALLLQVPLSLEHLKSLVSSQIQTKDFPYLVALIVSHKIADLDFLLSLLKNAVKLVDAEKVMNYLVSVASDHPTIFLQHHTFLDDILHVPNIIGSFENCLICILKSVITDQKSAKTVQNILKGFIDRNFESSKHHLDGLRLIRIAIQADWEIGKSILADLDILKRILEDETLALEKDAVQLESLKLVNLCLGDKKFRDAVLLYLSKPNQLEVFCKSPNDEVASVGSIIQTKLITSQVMALKESDEGEIMEFEMIEKLKDLIALFTPDRPHHVEDLIESFSVLSLNGCCKEYLAGNSSFWSKLLSIAGSVNGSSFYGICSIINNLVSFGKPLSDEQQQLINLQKFAKQYDKVYEPHEMDGDSFVERRILGLVTGMQVFSVIKLILGRENRSINVNLSILDSLLHISRVVKVRSLLVKHLGLSPILKFYQKDSPYNELAAAILARIAISMNPSIAFPSLIGHLIKPLLDLCAKSENELYQFEGLLALTNIASTGEDACNLIFQNKGISILEYLQLSDNIQIRRAATEVLCNLCTFDPVIRYFDAKPERTQVLMAFIECESDDLGLALAAGGAIAVLSCSRNLCEYWAETKDYLKRICQLACGSENADLNHRGLAVLASIVAVRPDLKIKIKARVQKRMDHWKGKQEYSHLYSICSSSF